MLPFFGVQAFQNRQMIKRLAVQATPKGESDGWLDKVALLYQTNLIIRCALIEGPTFFNVLLFFITGSVFNFAMVGLGLVLLFFQFPFFNKFIAKIEWLIDSAKEESKHSF